jgi:hypothetical protein
MLPLDKVIKLHSTINKPTMTTFTSDGLYIESNLFDNIFLPFGSANYH